MSIRVDKVQLQFEINTKNKDNQSLHKLNEDIRAAYKSVQQLEKKHKELLSQPPKNKTSQEYKDWKAQVSLVGKALQDEQNHLADLDHKKSKLINTMGKEKMTIHELQSELKQYNILLNNLTPGTESFNKVQEYVKDLKKQLADYREEINNTQSSLTKFIEGFNKFAWATQFVYQGFQKVVQWADQYVQSFAKMDDAMTDVMKYTNQTKREVKEMNETFKQMTTRTPREELNALAGAAGRLGITARKDIEGFVDAADKINVALGDDLGEGAIDQIGKLTMVFGEDKTKGLNGAMLATGSTQKEPSLLCNFSRFAWIIRRNLLILQRLSLILMLYTMPRQPRQNSGTGIYHVMLRGINHQDIFENREDYLKFLRLLQLQTHPKDEKGLSLPPRCVIYAYCLMTNHVHLLIRECDEGIAEPIRSITIAYAIYFNKRYNRSGHLFQDRFKSEPVDDMAYFVTLLRYIHQNPIAGGITSNVRDYTWSSWCEYEGRICAVPVCTTQHVFARISHEDLTELVNEPLTKALNILDFDNEKAVRVADEKVKDYIISVCGVSNLTEIQHYPKIQRNTILRKIRDYGASIRQIARLTGISEGIIRKIK